MSIFQATVAQIYRYLNDEGQVDTQQEFADKIGYNVSTISILINQKKFATSKMIRAIIEHYPGIEPFLKGEVKRVEEDRVPYATKKNSVDEEKYLSKNFTHLLNTLQNIVNSNQILASSNQILAETNAKLVELNLSRKTA